MHITGAYSNAISDGQGSDGHDDQVSGSRAWTTC